MYGEVDSVLFTEKQSDRATEGLRQQEETDMETVKIGVSLSDREYRSALLRGLSHESRDFQFTALDDEEDGGVQILITDKDDVKGSGAMVIRLTYHELYDMSSVSGRMEIFRYEDARVFIGKIIYYYAREKGIDLYFHGKRKCRRVVFSSLRGGCGTTSAAMTAARFLKYRFGKKTLFISLCPLDGSRRYTGAADGGNMLALLYHLSAGDDVPLCKFISSSEGVDHIRGQSNNRAASEMSSSAMKRLLRMIDDMGEYDYVIFDVGDHIGSLAGFLMERADVRVVVRHKDDPDEEALCEYTEPEKPGAGRAISVTDFGDSSGAGGEISLTYEPEAFIRRAKRTYIDIRGRYGKDVSLLAERIVGAAE